jgi:hypothetical protein
MSTMWQHGGENPLVIGRHAAEPSNLLDIAGRYPPRRVPALLTLYTGDVLAPPRYPVVVPWKSGSSGRFRD